MDGYATKVVLIEPITSNKLNIKLKGKLILDNETVCFEIASKNNIFRELLTIFRNIENCTYRLSLNYKWNPFEEKYVSTITKINSNTKELLYIHCSKEYRKFLDFFQQLNRVEQLQTIENPYGIKFFIDKPEQIVEKEEVVKNENDKIKTSWLIATGVVIVCICLLITFSYVFSDNKIVNIDSKIAHEEIVSNTGHNFNEKKVVPNESIMPLNVKEPFTYFNIEESVIYGLPEGKVALTFDDGPSQFTEEIVNILLDYEIGATFFFVGTRAKFFPNGAKYVRDHHMVVANHSWTHTNFFKLTEEERLKELNLTNETLHLLDNESILFRPPYGLYDEEMVNQLKERFKFVLWNRDPRDWQARSQEEIIEYFHNSNPSGAIYILHENEYTVSALPQIIEWIKQHDVEFVVLK